MKIVSKFKNIRTLEPMEYLSSSKILSRNKICIIYLNQE